MGLHAAADTGSRFVAYVEELASVIGHADRERPLRDYCTGLVMSCEQPMAAVTAPRHIPNSIATVRRRLNAALVSRLPRCPCCAAPIGKRMRRQTL